MKTISIEQLAEKLHGKLWVKGGLKRIYLDEGYNTKKMTTKTYVYQLENGTFAVSCHVDCPSQPWQWCKSQEEEVIRNVDERIANLLATEVYFITNKAGEVVNENNKVVPFNDLYESDYYISKEKAEKALNDFPEGFSIKEMDRDQFNSEVTRLEELARPERERGNAEAKAKRETEEAEVKARFEKMVEEEKSKRKENPVTTAPGTRVRHSKFGLGTVVSEDNRIVEIAFDAAEHGIKKLIKEYAKFEIL